MIQTTDEKIKAALWETTRVLNQILNDSPPQVSLFDRARRAYDQATAALRDETRDKFVRDMDTPIATPSPGAGGSVGAEPAMKQFTELMSAVDESPIERLRFFCSLAMNAQDWLDVEPLFDALATPAPSVPLGGGEVEQGPVNAALDCIDELDGEVDAGWSETARHALRKIRPLLNMLKAEPQAQDAAPVEPEYDPLENSQTRKAAELSVAQLREGQMAMHGGEFDQYRMAMCTAASILEAMLSVPPAGVQGDAARLDYEIEESSSTRIEARIEAAALDKYTVLAFRDSEEEDWSIIVTAPNGIKDYDGTWRNSSAKTTEEIIAEAVSGAMLTPLPTPSLAYRPAIAQSSKGA